MRISELSDYVVPGEDVTSGDQIEFLDAGIAREFENRVTPQFKVKLPSGKVKLLAVNRTSCRNLAKVYGDDTVNWVNKFAIVNISEQNVRGEMKKVIYLSPVQ